MEAAKFAKEAKVADTARIEAEGKLATETKARMTAEKDAKEKDDLVTKIATELKPAKVLPEKWTPADVVAGVKTVASLAARGGRSTGGEGRERSEGGEGQARRRRRRHSPRSTKATSTS